MMSFNKGPLCLSFDPCSFEPCAHNEICMEFGSLGEYECMTDSTITSNSFLSLLKLILLIHVYLFAFFAISFIQNLFIYKKYG